MLKNGHFEVLLHGTRVCPNLIFAFYIRICSSPDGGVSLHWLTGYPGHSVITVFTCSPLDGTYAFLTELQEVGTLRRNTTVHTVSVHRSAVPRNLFLDIMREH